MWLIITALLRFLLLYFVIKFVFSLLFKSNKQKSDNISGKGPQKRFSEESEDIVDAEYEEIDNNR